MYNHITQLDFDGFVTRIRGQEWMVNLELLMTEVLQLLNNSTT